jgi:hypothetical protein
MLLIDNWIHALAAQFNDPLLSAERILALKKQECVAMSREDREILGVLCMMPLERHYGVLSLWISPNEDPLSRTLIGEILVANILRRAARQRLTVLVPQELWCYIHKEDVAPFTVDLDMQAVQREMNAAGIPRNHAMRRTEFMGIRPAPTSANAPLHSAQHSEL